MLDLQLTYSLCAQNGNEMYQQSKISDYFDIHSDSSCNVRHSEEHERDPLSILETEDRAKARKCSFHLLVDSVTAQLRKYRFLLSALCLDERKMKIYVTTARCCGVSTLKIAFALV